MGLVDDAFEKSRGWHAYGFLMVAWAASVTILPNATTDAGTIALITNEMHIPREIFALVCFLSGIYVYIKKPRNGTYILSSTPLLFYCVATLLYTLGAGVNMIPFFTYAVLYLGIFRDVSRP